MTLYLVVASLMGFLLRQPVTHLVKISSGRRPASERPAAVFWSLVYGAVGGLHVIGFVLRGYGFLLWLALPGIGVFAWHLALVRRRHERRQLPVEVLATGFLALAAPAAYWIGRGEAAPYGWLLWALVWSQSIASILHVHLRLRQRIDGAPSDLPGRARLGIGVIRWTTLNLVAVAILAMAGIVPEWLVAPYLVQWLEGILGTLRPAGRTRPSAIGGRQLAVSILFTVLFILAFAGFSK